jgi:chemotaxis response regulator CheB
MADSKQRESKSGKTRILIVDDHAIVRFGIAQVINRQTDMMVCG